MYARKGFMKRREKNTYNHPANSTATGMERVIVKTHIRPGYPKGVVESFKQTENKGVNLCKHLLSLLVIGPEGYVRYDLLL